MKDIIFGVVNNIYFYPKEENCCVIINNKSYIAKFMVSLGILPIQSIMTYEFKQRIKYAKHIILTDSSVSPKYVLKIKRYISKYILEENIYFYFMNTIESHNKIFLKYFNTIYTFDFNDATNYNISFKHTPYTNKISLQAINLDNDVLFLGNNKDRINIIREIKDILNSVGIKTKFFVLGCQDKDMKLEKYMNYDKYLEYVNISKCLLEINKTGQSGCSLRFLEAIFFKKKLITNNKYIVHDIYYDSRNVFILGIDKVERLREFINSPYVENDKDISQLYFTNWIEGFIIKKNIE